MYSDHQFLKLSMVDLDNYSLTWLSTSNYHNNIIYAWSDISWLNRSLILEIVLVQTSQYMSNVYSDVPVKSATAAELSARFFSS